MADEAFLTTGDVLGYLRVNLRTVYRLIKAGKIPAVRVGRQWRFRKSDIDAWLESQHARGPRPAARPRALVVSEDALRDRPLASALAAAGCATDTAGDGRAALERLARAGADLLVTGLRLPDMDGLAVVREARREAPGLPVIIVTGFSSEAAAIEAANLGVAGYLTTPVTTAGVLAATARALGRAESAQRESAP